MASNVHISDKNAHCTTYASTLYPEPLGMVGSKRLQSRSRSDILAIATGDAADDGFITPRQRGLYRKTRPCVVHHLSRWSNDLRALDGGALCPITRPAERPFFYGRWRPVMGKALAVILTVGMLLGSACQAPQIHSAEDSSGCECSPPTPAPDPVPCIRAGIVLAGHADWLLETLDDGDATQLGDASEALSDTVDAYETCAAILVADISAYGGR